MAEDLAEHLKNNAPDQALMKAASDVLDRFVKAKHPPEKARDAFQDVATGGPASQIKAAVLAAGGTAAQAEKAFDDAILGGTPAVAGEEAPAPAAEPPAEKPKRGRPRKAPPRPEQLEAEAAAKRTMPIGAPETKPAVEPVKVDAPAPLLTVDRDLLIACAAARMTPDEAEAYQRIAMKGGNPLP
jgi:hypothetical protein